jgi:hypothetical protein
MATKTLLTVKDYAALDEPEGVRYELSHGELIVTPSASHFHNRIRDRVTARLMEMLAEIGIEPEVSCLATTPADIQWMIQSGSGLALIDQKTPLDPTLSTRPIANVNWTADTAFVHPASAQHPALPVLVRHIRKMNGIRPTKHMPRRKAAHELQMKLLA